jgi:ribosome-associated protein
MCRSQATPLIWNLPFFRLQAAQEGRESIMPNPIPSGDPARLPPCEDHGAVPKPASPGNALPQETLPGATLPAGDIPSPEDTSTLRLDHYLKLTGRVRSGGEAKHRIQSGDVNVNGVTETHRSRKLRRGDQVALDGTTVEAKW